MTAWTGIAGPAAAALGTVTALGAIRHRVVRPARTRTPRPRGAATAPMVRRVALAAALAAMVMTAGALVAAIVVATTALGLRLRPLAAARRRRRDIERDLPDAVDLLVLGIRAGLTPRQSVESVARSGPVSVRPAFGAVVDGADRGAAFADALAVLGDQLGAAGRSMADVLATADRYGFPLAPVLDQLVVEARAARRRLAEADARRLPVRLSFPLVSCTLPSFVLLAIAPAVVAALSSLGTTSW